jgi:hypothetical protein
MKTRNRYVGIAACIGYLSICHYVVSSARPGESAVRHGAVLS